MSSPIIVALDGRDASTLLALVDRLAGRIAMFKIGLEAFSALGRPFIEEVGARGGQVFLDLKLHDIPNTVAGAVAALSGLPVRLMTVHAAGGPRMIAAAKAEAETAQVMAVTVLTSLGNPDIAGWARGDVGETSHALAALALGAGADGVVCAPTELARLAPLPGLRVVPGIRPAGAAQGDQARVATPAAALAAGADYLVIGRPITGSADPVAAVDAIHRQVNGPDGR